MNAKKIEEAFQRHPRPQLPTKIPTKVPTKVALQKKNKVHRDPKPVASLQSNAPSTKRTSVSTRHENPWQIFSYWGDLIQGSHKFSLGVYENRVVMVKRSNSESGRFELEKLKLLDHPNIASVKEAFDYDGSIYIQVDYARLTLEEILNVHVPLQEAHICVIATSIFSAIKHIATVGIVHNAISPTTIRLCSSSGRVLLASFEQCTWQTTEITQNIDLARLGLAVLECMNGSPSTDLRDLENVRRQRKVNKMFGLQDGASWSGYKMLIDFLDDMLNKDKPAIVKLDRPHRYVLQESDHAVFVPLMELVTFECFHFWQPSATPKNDSK